VYGKPIKWMPIDQILPAPENDTLYGPVDPADPKIQQMAGEMRQEGKCRTLLTLSHDYYVMDGHRRLVAATLAGLTRLQCIIDPILHDDREFVKELVRYNNQRIKSNDVLFREAVVATSKEDAYQALKKARAQKAQTDTEVEEIQFTGQQIHNSVTEFRMPFLNAVIDILNANRQYWPLTARQIHYRLLNNPPLRHSSKDGVRMTRRGVRTVDSTYRNDKESYNALIRLLRDARLDERIPWEVIDDPTRPVTLWNVHRSTQPYVEAELNDFLRGYARDLLQSQPNHIELFAEKKTLSTILRPLSSRFCMPMTIGSGSCSIAPIRKLVKRFEKSGKEKLIILAIADLDPAGMMIARSFCQRLRDYFGIEDVDARRVALTMDQVDDYHLPPGGNTEEKDDVNKNAFEEAYGSDTYEVEALEPAQLTSIVEEAILQSIDIDAFNHEIEREEADSQFLEARRTLIMDYAASLPSEGEQSS
jgi:hypothetical protein